MNEDHPNMPLPDDTDFEPPSDSDLPEELQGPTPRMLPDSISEGPLAQSRKKTFWGCGVAGAFCFLIKQFPFVDTLALYVLPLGYLVWIGIALFLIGLLSHAYARELRKASQYIEQGTAAFGKVVAIVKSPTTVVNGQTVQHAFVASLQIRHPDSDEICLQNVKSRDFNSYLKDYIGTSFRVGDYIPVVWMPNHFEETLQVYDFLEITSEFSLVRGMAGKQDPLWQTIIAVIAVPLLFFILFWNLYAFGRYSPLDFDYWNDGFLPMLVGGLICLTVLIVSYLVSTRKKQCRIDRQAQTMTSGEAVEVEYEPSFFAKWGMAILMILGSILLGGITVLCWCFTANALFDSSPLRKSPAQVIEMTEVTHAFLFREFRMEYQIVGEGDENTMLTTPEHLDQFMIIPDGNAVIRKGWLGWEWVETIEPLVVIPNELIQDNVDNE